MLQGVLNVFHNAVVICVTSSECLHCVCHAEQSLLACIWGSAVLLRQLAIPQLSPPEQHAPILWA